MTYSEMEQAIQQLRDAALVQAQLEARLSRGLADAARWLEAHEGRIQRAELALERAELARQRTELNLAEATDKLNALIKFVAGQHNLPEGS